MAERSILVVGGGLVGATTALGLQQQGYAVTLLEPAAAKITRGELGVDIRNVALNPQSQSLLATVGAWDDSAVVPYQDMQVWEESGTGCMNFSAASTGQEALGWLAEMSPLQVQLFDLCQACLQVVQAGLAEILVGEEGVSVTTDQGDVIEADFLVAADGAQSRVRSALGIGVQRFPVGQHALATVVRTERPHGGVARQRFLHAGPLALLPAENLQDANSQAHLVSIVWSQPEAQAKERANLPAAEFCALLTRVSEGALGAVLEVDQRFCFPLEQQLADTFLCEDRVVLLGDAARVVHPLAGLGVNLGFEDVLALLQVTEGGVGLSDARRNLKFERQRQTRSRHMIKLLGLLQRAYGNGNPWLTLARNFTTQRLEKFALVKQQIMREAMGLGPISQIKGLGPISNVKGLGPISQVQGHDPVSQIKIKE